MITIPVSPVTPAPEKMDALDRDAKTRSLLAKRVEAIYASDAKLVACDTIHPFVKAAHDAFYEHRPLVLTPDSVWFCLAQGLAHHVNLHVERLRARFVKHQGKIQLTIRRPDFALGKPNPWPEAFAMFSDAIAEHVGKLRDLIVPEFSTTTPTSRAAAEVALMDTFQGYFKYGMMAGCGIPEITLLGTVEDWRSLRRRAQMFGELDLEDWSRALSPVLDRIVETAEGKPSVDFWRSFFHYQSGSGPSILTGWIHVLFPYLKDREKGLHRNPHLATWEREFTGENLSFQEFVQMPHPGPAVGEIPSGLASAPVSFTDVRTGEETMLRFVGGMFGVVEDARGALQPELGWAIVYD
jgi:hypothetical protein